MFVEEKSHGEPVQVGTLKLSEAIRKGKPLINENSTTFRLCALGCAWAGVKGREADAEELAIIIRGSSSLTNAAVSRTIGKHLGFDPELCARVSALHGTGMPALIIADKIEAEGY